MPTQSTPSGTVLCAATVAGAPFRERVAAARAAGFDAISLFPEQYLDARKKEGLTPADMRQLLADHDINVATVDPLLDWYGDGASKAEALLMEMARELGAPALNAATAFAPDLPLPALAEALARLCQRAAERDLRVDLEILPWSRVGSYREAFELVDLADQPNCAVTLDCLHFYRSGGTVQDLQQLSVGQRALISNIQLCDIPDRPARHGWGDQLAANKVMLDTGRNGLRVMGLSALLHSSRKAYTGRDDANTLMREATCHRLLPGQGDIPLVGILQALFADGHCPTIGLEVFSLALNRLSAADAANRCMAAWQTLHRTAELAP